MDHRLVRHQHLRRSGPESWALYLFLVTVADAQGLSYYSEASIARYLNLDPVLIAAARQHLIQLDLLAYHKPLYQVLALPEEPSSNPPAPGQRSGQARTVGDILRQALGGTDGNGGQER